MDDLDKELDWILNKNWEDDETIHTKYDGTQYTGYVTPPKDERQSESKS